MEEQGGLAHPRFCNQGYESALRLNPIKQGSQSLLMGRAEIEKLGIRSNPEWLPAQTEMIEEHPLYL